jgi:membrane-bound lytic murein transglycosylase B
VAVNETKRMYAILAATLLAAALAPRPALGHDADRGWGYLIDKLAADGVPRERAETVFRDERVDPYDGLEFSLNPREPQSLYRHLRTRTTAARARACRERWADAFDGAEREYGVSPSVVAAIIQVESGCGRNTGRSRIFPALARLAMATEPRTLEENIERHTLLGVSTSGLSASHMTRWRAQELEDTFYPQVKASFEIADRMQVDPLDIRGSGSGAFGIPQFLPTSYLLYGVDGDGDGRVSLYDPEDAIPSCARYLREYGWHAGLTRTQQRKVVWGYNHSDAYIDTVLWLADEVRSPSPLPVHAAQRCGRRAPPAVAKKRPAHAAKTRPLHATKKPPTHATKTHRAPAHAPRAPATKTRRRHATSVTRES